VISELTKQLRLEEGVMPCAYRDHLGFLTIGVGRLVDKRKPGSGLRPEEIDFMLRNDIDDRINALHTRLPWFQDLDDARRGALVAMSFQLGVEGLLGFERTLTLIREGKYENAAHAMLQSKWAQQTPERAQRMAEQMRTGLWQYAPGA
jgi:lysozyme